MFTRDKIDNFNFKVFDFSKIRKTSLILILPVIIILALGFCALYSADTSLELFYKQLFSMLIFIPIFIVISCLNPILIKRYSYLIYFGLLFLLFFTFLKGKIAMGAKRWLSIFGLKIQTSEFMKIGIILAISKYFSQMRVKYIRSVFGIILPFLIGFVPIFLVIIQPDLGTAMIIIILFIMMLFISGIKIWKFVLSGCIVVISIPIIWANLHDYQKARVANFLSPEKDKLGSGYSIYQSKISIGSGGILGSGIGLGSQSKLKFVPENETDFIFTVVAEETGFIGSLILILSYIIMFIHGYTASNQIKDFFLKVVTYSSVSLLFLHISINLAMTMGLVPVVGVPLPFVSYGRSSMFVSTLLLGFINNGVLNKNLDL